MLKDQPRVLIISHNSLSLHQNNGKTLHSLFQEWPTDSIAQLYFQSEVPESSKFNNFFRLTDLDIIKTKISLNKKKCGQQLSINREDRSKYSFIATLRRIFVGLLKDNIGMILILRNKIYGTDLWKSENLIHWIGKFKPDIIFYLGGNYVFSFRITAWISEKFKIPFVVYLTDDYVLNLKPKNNLEKDIINELKNTYSKTFKEARKRFVIGELMAKSFSEYFKYDFIPIMNTTEIRDHSLNEECTDNENVRVVYMGGLHLNRWKKLVEFGQIVYDINQNFTNRKKIVVEIFSISPPRKKIINLLNNSPLRYFGALYGGAVVKKLNEADILLHVESDEEPYRSLTKLSISTKLSEYFASHKCVIGFGPSDVASIRLLSDNNIGITLTELDSNEDKREKILKLVKDRKILESYGERSYQYALKNFHGDVVREKLKILLNDCIIQRNEGNNA